MSFPFSVDTARIAGAGLWSLGLYLGFSPVSERVLHQVYQWLNLAEKLSQHPQAQTAHAREIQKTQHTVLASLLSVLPFLLVGALLNYGVELGLGRGWAISMGMIACISCGVYELGRRDGRASG